ncbi:hypothetical protein NDK47_13820 [Brevibacillus ruminantium]|uniref:Uncharacterized protein n=1 Tax=Brevibacillus ruminantium TaxID=2950604 RepID=A0ABY4WMA3_9BACL|nr:hypothetical protein [Brevibacillus ruminantium]USG68286.1 hypothetical protein NDK47_13820 [Brevibacillus ruminantium]
MNRIWLFMFMLIGMFVIPATVYAGGEMVMKIRSGDQDALIIGKVSEYKDGKYSVHVEEVLMGEMTETDITVNHPNAVDPTEPSAGDYGLFSLVKEGTDYAIKNGAYTVDKTDYKTLKVAYANESYGALGHIQRFINSGEFIEADKQAKEKKKQKETEQAAFASHSIPSIEDNRITYAVDNRILYAACIAGVLVLGGLLYTARRVGWRNT